MVAGDTREGAAVLGASVFVFGSLEAASEESVPQERVIKSARDAKRIRFMAE
jgi:hypothetical protein